MFKKVLFLLKVAKTHFYPNTLKGDLAFIVCSKLQAFQLCNPKTPLMSKLLWLNFIHLISYLIVSVMDMDESICYVDKGKG